MGDKQILLESLCLVSFHVCHSDRTGFVGMFRGRGSYTPALCWVLYFYLFNIQ